MGMTITMLKGDCRAILPTLPAESVHCVVTSPPYWGLRDYGTATWEGGDPLCNHGPRVMGNANKGNLREVLDGDRTTCHHCGARRIDSQIGLEPTPEAYVATMVEVFREVRRVLRKDGTVWLNLGDSYAATTKGSGGPTPKQASNAGSFFADRGWQIPSGLKPKDLCGIPWRVAFALQADGWYLRQDIIWSKPNPMPESVTDRCTKAHEYMFLLSKSARYYYDADAIAETADFGGKSAIFNNAKKAARNVDGKEGSGNERPGAPPWFTPLTRNKRSVWEVATAPFSEAHFATFPPALIEPCIKAGTSEKGCCAKCGAPWTRETEIARRDTRPNLSSKFGDLETDLRASGSSNVAFGLARRTEASVTTVGWSPSCSCNADSVPCTVLDPFGGAGTTGLVADRLGRNAMLIELNPEYATMAEYRIIDDAPLFARVVAAE
jgi:DNA modification methylase